MEHLKSYVVANDQEYYISTNNTPDVEFETMVFKSENKCVTNWREKFFKHYNTREEAIEGHNYIINNLEKCLEEGETQDWVKETITNHMSMKDIVELFEEISRDIEKRKVNKYE